MSTVTIPKKEYARLKKIDSRFRAFIDYFQHLADIREARTEVKKGKAVAQEKLFERIGL